MLSAYRGKPGLVPVLLLMSVLVFHLPWFCFVCQEVQVVLLCQAFTAVPVESVLM